MHNDNLIAAKYHDRKIVYLLSTVETAIMTKTKKEKRFADGTREAVKKPSVVLEYDKFLGGVDRADQMLNYAPFPCKTVKWWKRLFFHIVIISVMNSFIMYLEEMPSRQRSLRGRPNAQDQPITRLVGKHYMEKIFVEGGKKKTPTRSCVCCSAVGKWKRRDQERPRNVKKFRYGRESSYQCKLCECALCVVPCFELYHSKTDFVAAYLEWEGEGHDDDADNE